MADSRLELLKNWLASLPPTLNLQVDKIEVASEDASFRRYFRLPGLIQSPSVNPQSGQPTMIVMDAPPPKEDVRPFINIAQRLLDAGLHAPRLYATNTEDGFLLLEDLGNATYLDWLNAESAPVLYLEAIDALIAMQAKVQHQDLRDYDSALLQQEMALYRDWYVPKHKNVTLSAEQSTTLQNAFDLITQNVLLQTKAFVHRDFHSRNLMLVRDANPGIIDFQDAVSGPITYDLVSLLKDAYIRWEEDQVMDWTIRYWEKANKAGLAVPSQFGDFYRDFEWMGLQRHLKVLGIFARLNYRDGKSRYLADMPQVLDYCMRVCNRYGALAPLRNLMTEIEGKANKVGYTF